MLDPAREAITPAEATTPREIILRNGLIALIDASDYPMLSVHRWNGYKNGNTWYAYRAVRHPVRGWKSPQLIMLHREIIGARDGQPVDHINRNGLDNRRENLRICTLVQNFANGRARRPGYRGVYVSGRKWEAKISAGPGKSKRLGTFETAEEAAHVWDIAAVARYGEFAVLNFPRDHGDSP